MVATAEFACDCSFHARDLENVWTALSASTFSTPIDGRGGHLAQAHAGVIEDGSRSHAKQAQSRIICLLPRCQVRITSLRSWKVYNSYARPGISIDHPRAFSTVVCGNMAQSSPSEFLTFYRTIRTTTTFSQHASRCLVRPATTSRPFSSSIQQYQQDLGPNKDHTVDKAKKDNLNVQTDASKKGTE